MEMFCTFQPSGTPTAASSMSPTLELGVLIMRGAAIPTSGTKLVSMAGLAISLRIEQVSHKGSLFIQPSATLLISQEL